VKVLEKSGGPSLVFQGSGTFPRGGGAVKWPAQQPMFLKKVKVNVFELCLFVSTSKNTFNDSNFLMDSSLPRGLMTARIFKETLELPPYPGNRIFFICFRSKKEIKYIENINFMSEYYDAQSWL
jgi:hypothetical protein